MVSSMLSFSPFIFNHHVQAHPFIVLSTSEKQVSFLPDWEQLGVDCSSLLLQPIHTPTGLFLAFIEFSKLNSMFRKSSRTIWRLCWVFTIGALLSHRILHFLKGSNRSEHIMFLKKGESPFLSSCAEGKLWAYSLDTHFYRKVLKISELVLHPDYNQVPHPSQIATRHKRIWRNLTHRMYSGHQLF